jgi:putative ABC transport system permease protein
VKYLPLVLRHLRHSWLRTTTTVLSVAVCVFLFCTLETITRAVGQGLRSTTASRLVVRNAISLFYALPLTYKEKVRSVPGVKNVAMANFYLLSIGGSADFFRHPAYSVDAAEYLAIYPGYVLTPEERKAFVGDRRGCIVGPDTARELGWKVGDTLELPDRVYDLKQPYQFVLQGIYRVDDVRYPGTDTRTLFFHHDYLEEATQHRAGAGFLVVEIDDPGKAATVSATIDGMFHDSERQTRTETESAFRAGIVSMAGNLVRLLSLVGAAVTFTILVVTANTMSMAVRERRREIAVLKAIGFGSGLVLALILCEALVLGLLGGALGVLFGMLMIAALPGLPLIGDAVRHVPASGLTPAVAAAGLGTALLLSLVAGFVPAVGAYRGKVVELLRTA